MIARAHTRMLPLRIAQLPQPNIHSLVDDGFLDRFDRTENGVLLKVFYAYMNVEF